MKTPMSAPAAPTALSLHDARPFFEKALAHGVQHGVIDTTTLDAIQEQAPRGMVQIARYFGSEFLRPELEKARERMVNLVSLYLQESCDNDLAAQYSLEVEHLEEAGADAEAVIRTALLWRALAPRASDWPHAVSFEKALTAQRNKKTAMPPIALPAKLPQPLQAVVQAQCAAVQAEYAKLLDAAAPNLRTLLRPMSAFRGCYLLLDDPLAEVDDYYREFADVGHEEGALDAPGAEEGSAPAPGSKVWDKATQGSTDEHALLTLFVSLAAGSPKKTLLIEKGAAALLRKIHKTGFDAERATTFIRDHAPQTWRASYLALWDGFVQESQATLCSDHVGAQQEALALLRRECHVQG